MEKYYKNVIWATRAEEVVSELKKEINEKNGSISAMKIDLNSFESVRNFVKEYESKYESLEILINNAGSTTTGTMTEDGFETAFQSNYMVYLLWCLFIVSFPPNLFTPSDNKEVKECKNH